MQIKSLASYASLLVALPPGALALLGQEDGLDVGQHTALGDDHAGQQFVELSCRSYKGQH